ncbi:MAG: DUF378 domain-containing protein [Candidatus Pacebacteria bacterium]|nr:DUF378 domain-containing protein [Candidatus Paceibacterota bacterium]
MKVAHAIAFILVIIGGLNWLLVGIFDWGVADLVGMMIAKIIYIIVGLSAIYLVVTHKKDCKHCETSAPATPAQM